MSGAELRQLRLAAGVTGEELTRRLEQFGFYPSKVSQLEPGRMKLTSFLVELLRRAINNDLKIPADPDDAYIRLRENLWWPCSRAL